MDFPRMFSCSIGFSCGFPMVFPWPQDGPEQRHQRHGGGTLHHEPSIGGAHRGSAARGARLRRMGWWKIWWILNGKWWFNGDYIYIYIYISLYQEMSLESDGSNSVSNSIPKALWWRRAAVFTPPPPTVATGQCSLNFLRLSGLHPRTSGSRSFRNYCAWPKIRSMHIRTLQRGMHRICSMGVYTHSIARIRWAHCDSRQKPRMCTLVWRCLIRSSSRFHIWRPTTWTRPTLIPALLLMNPC